MVAGFFVFVLGYTTFRGYTIWFWLRPTAKVLVDGQVIPGYVHQSSRAMIITRRDTTKLHSYLVVFRNDSKLPVLDCGSWIAPRSPLFPTNHEALLCAPRFFDDAARMPSSDAPQGIAEIGPDQIVFKTHNGNVVEVKR